MRAVALLCAVALAIPCVLAQPGTCDPEYECVYQASTIDGITFTFDLRPLCKAGGYAVNDSSGHTYSFNVCGTAKFECEPRWADIYAYGVAVQYWGAPPPCNLTDNTTQSCTNYKGQKICCTEDCQVLGVGPPQWQLVNTNNPEIGGLLVTHRGVPPAEDDPFYCPWNPKTQSQTPRAITFNISCNLSMPFGALVVTGALETSPCQYMINMQSFHGCGCSPNCANMNCGGDGCGGYCGSPGSNGACPIGYECLEDNTCCKADCAGRECGNDGCGGFCGTPNGRCGDATETCVQNQCVPVSPWPAPQGSPIPVHKNSPGTLAGSFFGGIFSGLVIGGISVFIYKRRFAPYQPAASKVTASPYLAAGGTSI